ncbi:unnamed protein product [Dovyalis caffra]|uniref:Calcium-transporting ATPase n=1 Tax=Dovyalis caffra TaxID=77055 RepID=A0AAV1QQM5_9ROSI|nr:unnamed protein product [Dovyalis caffra]
MTSVLEILKTTIPAAISATLQSSFEFLKAALPGFFSIAENDTEETLASPSDDMAPRVTLVVVASDHRDHEQRNSNAKLQRASIAETVKAKDFESLHEFGGIQRIAEALDSDINTGIPAGNTITKAPLKAFIQFPLKSFDSGIVFLLLVSTMLSLVSMIMQKGSNGWLEGGIVLLAMLILVIAPALRNYWKQKLPENGRTVVEVIRGACHQQILPSNVLVGDVVCLERGHLLPADGLLISGQLLVLNDGSESTVNDQNPFLLYGSIVVNGSGCMLVTSVGENTVWRETISNVDESKKQRLQAQLGKVITCLEVVGLVISILITGITILTLILKKDIQNPQLPDSKGKPKMVEEIIDSIKRVSVQSTGKIASLAIYLIGAVEGFPFFLALAISFWNKKALCGRAYAQQPSACVSMGSVTTIITDKTSLPTLEMLEVDTFCIADEIISQDTVIDSHVLEAICNGISVPIVQSPSTSMDSFLLSWATWNLGLKMENLEQISCVGVMMVEGKNPNEEGNGVLTRRNEGDGAMSLQWRGHPTTILAMCSRYYDSKGAIHDMDAQKRNMFQKIIGDMQSKKLKTIAFGYRQVDAPALEGSNLILLGMMGMKDLCLQDTKDAMEVYRDAGVNIILVSRDDNLSGLKNVAHQTGLLTPNSDAIVIHAETFRAWTDEERMETVDKIAVMGNASPSDRLRLVKCLKEKEEVVAVVGATINDVPSLKQADLGIAMGKWSTKMARESSGISAWDGDFMFLTTLIGYGRCAYKNIQKYIQLEVTILAAWLSVSFVMAASTENTITTVQFVWINFIMTALGGLALLTQPESEKLMQNPPTGRTKRLITNAMWRNIVTQVSYQIAMQVTFCFKGQALLGINGKVSKIIAFHTYALCQVFNILNAREPEMKNVFKGIRQHVYFWVAVFLAVALQEVFMLIAHIFSHDAWLNWRHQGFCFLIGALCLAVDSGTKCISGFTMDILTGWPFSLRPRTCTSMLSSGISESASVIELPEIFPNNNISKLASSVEDPPSNDNLSESIDRNLDLPPVDSDATALPT